MCTNCAPLVAFDFVWVVLYDFKVSFPDKKIVWSGNATITQCRPTIAPQEAQQNITATKHQEDRQNKATSAFFTIKTTTNPERAQSIAHQNMKQTQNSNNRSNTKQRIDNNRITTSEQTATQTTPTLNAFY